MSDAIWVYPNHRVHITLIDMSSDGYRKNGGIGFALSNPEFCVRSASQASLDLSKLESVGFSGDEIERIRNALEDSIEANNFKKALSIESISGVSRHVGLGSGTSISMSLLESLYLLNDAPYCEADIIRGSGRGGTSGVGVNLYFHGGMVVDLGRPNDGSGHVRSGDQKDFSLPVVLSRIDMPSWSVGVWVADGVKAMSAQEEKKFFRTFSPIPMDDVRAALYEVISGVWGSVREHRFSDFCTSVSNIQGLKWKKSEISLYGEAIRSRLDFLMREGVSGAGMSSLGPLIYFFSDSIEDIRRRIVREFPSDEVFVWSIPNHGRRILSA